MVSVPSRGILFPNNKIFWTYKRIGEMFPSPLGVSYFQIIFRSSLLIYYPAFPSPLGVSYFQMELIKRYEGEVFKFPSPLGVSYFQMMTEIFDKTFDEVSVPSRGILFPNSIFAFISSNSFLVVSVPSRGILFPNSAYWFQCTSIINWVSVPSRGILFPNGGKQQFNEVFGREKVSVPSRGILFPNKWKWTTTKQQQML